MERQFDTTGRGFSRTYDGRGLVKTETPLVENQVADPNLTVTHDYDSVGRHLTQTSPTGTKLETVYDDFGRVSQSKRVPIAGQGMFDIVTAYEYDQASNVTRASVSENGIYLSDGTALFDEGGFNYETRQRLTAGTEGSSDPLMQRKFDWAGNVTEDRWLGDETVSGRSVVNTYDSANRLESMTDSTGGSTQYIRDQRGNVTEQRVKLNENPLNEAITTTVFDALSRPIQVTEPEDQFSLRADRTMEYDSRNDLLRELRRDSSDVPKMQTRASFDAAGRQMQVAIMANASQTGGTPLVTTDRVTNFEYDADGRLLFRKTYNNNSSTALTTATIYDALGRVDRVTDPSGSYNEDNYLPNGRLQDRQVNDGISTRTFTIGYDGHDRINSQTAVGPPDLVTTFTLDALDRTTKVVDPRLLATSTTFDLVGRRTVLLEDAEGVGSLQRRTDFTYNRLSQLITQTAQNKNNDGSNPTQQITRFRYDSLGRLRRSVYPDNTTDDTESEIENCTDCERMEYDVAGRMTSHTDQRGTETAYLYEDRGPVISRTAGSDIDSYEYDALGRTKISQRGTAGNSDASARTETLYNDIGDLTQQKQTIAEGTLRTVDYTYDQAGNRTLLAYPGGRNLTGNSTVLNQPDQLILDGSLLVDYAYNGRLLTGRQTNVPTGGSDYYAVGVGYDVHRRVNSLVNTVFNGVTTTLAQFGFTHDNDGNVLTQTADGVGGFDGDDRTFTIDRLNRVTATDYSGTPADDNSVLDRVGNRESHTNRAGTATAYTLANLANEYATVGGTAVTYDATGNLSVDEAGRQYFYDEHDRLKQVKNAGGTVLANYTYDGLGRRVTFNDAVAGTTLRYYYDGAALIEERDASDSLLRYHVNGRQYVDERAATFIPSTSDWKFHLLGNNFSVVGTGEDAGHPNVTRFDFGALGDFVSTPPPSGTFTMHGQQIDVLSDGLVLMHFRARVYDPKNGRWLQRDPSGYSDGPNLYESFAGNPLVALDPLGLWIVERIAQIRSEKGQLTVADIQALADEMNADVDKQTSQLTYEERRLLSILGGPRSGVSFAETDIAEGQGVLYSALRGEAAERYPSLTEAEQFRAIANFASRRRLLMILTFRNQAFAQYVTELYRTARDLNPVHFVAEREYQMITGEEMLTGEKVSRGRVALELAAGLVVGKAVGLARRATTKALATEASPRPAIVQSKNSRASVTDPPTVAASSKNAYNIPTQGMTAAEREAILIYARRVNAWLAENGPVTIQSTRGSLRSQANALARAERLRASRAGHPYQGQAGHVPDTSLTGQPNPPAGWLDMPGRSNSVAGGGLGSRLGQRVEVITVDGQIP